MPKLLTVEDVASALHLDKQTIWRYVREGRLPAKKVGRRYLFQESALEAMLEPEEPQQSGKGTEG